MPAHNFLIPAKYLFKIWKLKFIHHGFVSSFPEIFTYLCILFVGILQVGLIFVFNLIVGTGALTLPAVFAQAGWLLSLLLIVMLAFVGFVTVTFVIESMACANATIQWRKIESHKVDVRFFATAYFYLKNCF